MDALNVWSVLFMVACFLFMYNVFVAILEVFGMISTCMVERAYELDVRLNVFVACSSFTYIMAFLFVW